MEARVSAETAARAVAEAAAKEAQQAHRTTTVLEDMLESMLKYKAAGSKPSPSPSKLPGLQSGPRSPASTGHKAYVTLRDEEEKEELSRAAAAARSVAKLFDMTNMAEASRLKSEKRYPRHAKGGGGSQESVSMPGWKTQSESASRETASMSEEVAVKALRPRRRSTVSVDPIGVNEQVETTLSLLEEEQRKRESLEALFEEESSR